MIEESPLQCHAPLDPGPVEGGHELPPAAHPAPLLPWQDLLPQLSTTGVDGRTQPSARHLGAAWDDLGSQLAAHQARNAQTAVLLHI